MKSIPENSYLKTYGARQDSWESLAQQGEQTIQSQRKSVLNIHWKDWSWSSNTLSTWWEEASHWKRPWCWERLKAKGEAGSRGWDGWMATLTQWTWIWANSWKWWRTGKPGVLQSMESQNWTWLSNWTTPWKSLSYWGKQEVTTNLDLCNISAWHWLQRWSF